MKDPETSQAKAASLRDVARAAGVSVATASKALNGRFDVKRETRLRVLQVAEELDFVPNEMARGLLTGRSQTVGLLTDGTDGGRFTFPVLLGVEDALGAVESTVMLVNTRGEQPVEAHYVRTFARRRVDAMIVVGDAPEGREPVSRPSTLPTVYAYAYSRDPRDISFGPDNVHGGELAVEHLVSIGRRRIAVIAGMQTWKAARDRVAGATAALRRLGGHLVGDVEYGTWGEGWGWQRVGDLIAAGETFDGLVCGSDQIARGAIDRLGSAGLGVPDDVAVVGFDNWEVVSQSRQPITSIDMNLTTLGQTAAKAVVGEVESSPGVHLLPCTLVVRGSTVRTADAS